MIAGLPGTGLGGLFYMMLVLLMPLREAYLTLHGRSSVERWKKVGLHWALGAGILAALYGFSWLIGRAILALIASGVLPDWVRENALHAVAVSSTTAIVISLSTLGLLAGVPALLYVVLGHRPTPFGSPAASARLLAAAPPPWASSGGTSIGVAMVRLKGYRASQLRPGDVESADEWDAVLLPVIDRVRAEGRTYVQPR